MRLIDRLKPVLGPDLCHDLSDCEHPELQSAE